MIKCCHKTVILFSFFCLLGFSTKASAFLQKNLWPIWQSNNPLSEQIIHHDEWQAFLSKNLVTNEEGINLIDYAHISPEDKVLVDNYLSRIAKIDIGQYNRREQLAFWINLYNALIVQTIIKYYPVNSISEINISPGLFSIGPWGTKLISVNDIPLSLDEIQNRIIRPIWNDMRSLYALNNGTIGAANLSKEAYRGKTINKQLNEAAYRYINSLRGVQVIDNEVIVSKLIDWYSEDFGETDAAILQHLRYFAKPELKKKLERIDSIQHYVYNWHLNKVIEEQS